MSGTTVSFLSQKAAALSKARQGRTTPKRSALPAVAAKGRSVQVTRCELKFNPFKQVKAKVEELNEASVAASVAMLSALTTPAPAQAGLESLLTLDYWKAFWEWRSESPLQFFGTIVVPTVGSYLLIKYLLDSKRDGAKKLLRDKGWTPILLDLGVDIEANTRLPELNYFVKSAEVGRDPKETVEQYKNYIVKKEGGSPTRTLTKEAPKQSLVEKAAATPELSIMTEAVAAAGLLEDLEADGPFTIFAPTDAAFGNLLARLGVSKEELLARDDLSLILKNHILDEKVRSRDVMADASTQALGGGNINIVAPKKILALRYKPTDPENGMLVNDAKVVEVDLEATNGYIHEIDTVLL